MNLTSALELLSIRPKEKGIIPLRLNWAQERIVNEVELAWEEQRPARIICLKARQLGCSTITEAILFEWIRRFPGTYSAVVAHNRMTAEHIYNMLGLYYDSYPYKSAYPSKYRTRRQLVLWVEDSTGRKVESAMEVMTAQNVQGGRGRTIHSLHCSEVALWPEAAETMLALKQTVPDLPGTLILVESTAFGKGNWFHSAWQAAEAGENDYVPMFFPAYLEPTYQMKGDPGNLDEDERELRAMGASDGHLNWRRYTIANKCDGDLDFYHQEFPNTPEEAFISTGRPAFDEEDINACYEPRRFVQGGLDLDPRGIGEVQFRRGRGSVRAYAAPKPGCSYYIGAVAVHPSMDYGAVAHVLNRQTGEQVCVWEGSVDPRAFATELAKLGTWYNEATIALDVDGPGYAAIASLANELHYPALYNHTLADRYEDRATSQGVLGFASGAFKRKEQALMTLYSFLQRREIRIHDEGTYADLLSCAISEPKGRYYDFQNPELDNQTSELLLSLSIACCGMNSEPPIAANPPRLIRSNWSSQPGIIFPEVEPQADSDWG